MRGQALAGRTLALRLVAPAAVGHALAAPGFNFAVLEPIIWIVAASADLRRR